jgi:transcriptional regulator with XRE-family HTH domain
LNAEAQIEEWQPAEVDGLAAEMRAHRLQELIRGRREVLKLSQEDVAGRLDISSRAYGNQERGCVKEWTDQKLYALARALEMTQFQTARLFWLAVGRAPQPDSRFMSRPAAEEDPSTTAFLVDYSVMMNALALPTFLIDHRWNIAMSNRAFRELFCKVRPHPTAMPNSNFLRFGLFHPDAPTILADYLNWQLSMLAQLASSLDRHDEDPTLQAIRREVYLRPGLRDTYLNHMPGWVLEAGADLVHDSGGVREIRHPDTRVGLQGCRLVEETPRPLQARGLTRITLVLTELNDREALTENRGHHDHHAA